MKIVHRRDMWKGGQILSHVANFDSGRNSVQRKVKRITKQTPRAPNDDGPNQKTDCGIDPMLAGGQNRQPCQDDAERDCGIRRQMHEGGADFLVAIAEG